MGFFSKVKKLWGGDTSADQALEQKSSQATVQTTTEADTQPTDSSTAPNQAAASPVLTEQWKAELSASLHGSRARISEWLGLLLAEIETADDTLWARLRHLFATLGATQPEAEAFITEFQAWITAMNLSKVDEFRSELRYRLILSLDLEQEEEERTNIFKKLTAGLSKTRERMALGLGAVLAVIILCLVCSWASYQHGSSTATAKGDKALAELRQAQADAVSESKAKALDRYVLAAQRADQTAADFITARQRLAETRTLITKEIPHATAGLDACAFGPDFLRVYNQALGLGAGGVPAPAGPGGAAADHAAARAADAGLR